MMVFVLAGSPSVNSTPTTFTAALSKMTFAAAQRFSSTSTPGRMRNASTLPPLPAFCAMNSAAAAPNAYPPIGCTNVTGQLVVTPRSKTTTGTPVAHAFSTAGVSASVVFGEMMNALQFLVCRSARSVICLSSLPPASTMVNSPISGCSLTSAFIVVNPVTRHGLLTLALEKQTCHLPPGLAYFAVSTMDGWIICNHGWAGSPSGVTLRCAIWRSKSAWLKNLVWPAVELAAGAPLDEPLPGFLVELHAAAASSTASASATVERNLGTGRTTFPSLNGGTGMPCRHRPR